MKCEYCGAELEEGVTTCPACGKQVEPVSEDTAAEITEDTAEETQTEQTPVVSDAPAETQKPKKSKTLPIVLGILAVAVIVAIIAIVQMGKSKQPAIEPESTATTEETTGETTGETAATDYVSYTVTADQLTDELLAQVVATCGDLELTNRDFPLYYWQQYYSFAGSYSSYLSYLMDTSLGLDEQLYDDTQTWQQAFMSSAVSMFDSIAAFYQDAQAAGFTLDAETEASIASIKDSLEATATSGGYESADAYLEDYFGPTITSEVYVEFCRMNITASYYLDSLTSAQAYTQDDVSAYYDENADSYSQSGVEKNDNATIDVRHILIVPAETNEDGTYTDAAWADAETQINAIRDEWLAGDATEDSFSALAGTYSADSSASNGGLISGVTPGATVTTFNDWCYADGRQVGDYGVVKSEYGYHLIYMSAIGDTPYWYTVAEADYLTSIANAIQDEVMAKYETAEYLDRVGIYDVLATDTATEPAE